MSVTIRSAAQPPWTVLSVTGDLDVVGAPELRQAVVRVVADGARRVALDITGLDFIDSFGIGAVVGALKRVRQRGGDLELVCPVPRIRRVFEICDLDRILVFHTSVNDLAGRDPRASAAETTDATDPMGTTTPP